MKNIFSLILICISLPTFSNERKLNEAIEMTRKIVRLAMSSDDYHKFSHHHEIIDKVEKSLSFNFDIKVKNMRSSARVKLPWW